MHRYPDSGFSCDRTFGLANSTADTELADHNGPLKYFCSTRSIRHFNQLEFNCFIRDRAHFLTNNTFLVFSPGQTTISINESFTNDLSALYLKRERWNSLNRADLTTGLAGIITITNPGHDNRSPETFHTSIQYCHLNSICRANGATFPASDTGAQQLFIHNTRRSDGSGRIIELFGVRYHKVG